MKIVIPGGSGHVGQMLARYWQKQGHEIVVLSRSSSAGEVRAVAWDGKTLGPWTEEFENADVILNLAGRSVNCRYTEANLKQMMDSRVDSTRVVGQAIAQAKHPPKLWFQASTATIYAHRLDAPNDEYTGILGGDEPGAPYKWNVSIEIAKAWERELDEADTPSTRKVALRSAMTMSVEDGSVFDTMARLAKKGLFGTSGSGEQYVSWVHEQDFVRALDWIIEHENIDGAINISSPNPVPNKEFNRILRQVLRVRVGLPTMSWMLELGALVMRTETELILKSRRVVPTRLLESGFTFDYPEWEGAAKSLAEAWTRRVVNSRMRV
ncbi:MAG: TIGR01777 family oxidoreductase [Fimbriimonadaceae bacterium]|nr:TIGR01777 family oxidoreductase [Fimbriimonadaceae bacterium]